MHVIIRRFFSLLLLLPWVHVVAQAPTAPEDLRFVRQSVRRFVFDEALRIPLASLNPAEVVGMASMYPVTHHLADSATVTITDEALAVRSPTETLTTVWFGGFNPFATYTLDLAACTGEGELGFRFTGGDAGEAYAVTVRYRDDVITDVRQTVSRDAQVVVEESISTREGSGIPVAGKLVLQLFGSGLTLYQQADGLPIPIGQSDFSDRIDLRERQYLQHFHSELILHLRGGAVRIAGVRSALSSGVGLADIRAMTYEDGSPLLDRGRLWYTMSIRGRALPHHLQGVFSLEPSTSDFKFEGVILFDRRDGLLRNEIASHIFYDRREGRWRGLTTGFSAYARADEEKQLLTVESENDPRFGFSVMRAAPFGMVGDIEDPHILFDEAAGKWRILTCENHDGYRAVLLESDTWNGGYRRIAGPVNHNSTGTSIQRIGGTRYCFSGSSERELFVYTYPELAEAGTLHLDLPPWDAGSGTRVWPNVVELPDGYPFRYVALMMDRYDYPGIDGPHWTYGALYLYHGYPKSE